MGTILYTCDCPHGVLNAQGSSPWSFFPTGMQGYGTHSFTIEVAATACDT
eukprot:gene21873-36465_t